MFQGHRMILKSGVEVGLGGVACVAGLGEKRQVRQLQVRHDPGNGIKRGESGLPLNMGMEKHQADEQNADPCHGQGQARFPRGKASPARFFPDESANQGS
jgi:hypothetical protein